MMLYSTLLILLITLICVHGSFDVQTGLSSIAVEDHTFKFNEYSLEYKDVQLSGFDSFRFSEFVKNGEGGEIDATFDVKFNGKIHEIFAISQTDLTYDTNFDASFSAVQAKIPVQADNSYTFTTGTSSLSISKDNEAFKNKFTEVDELKKWFESKGYAYPPLVIAEIERFYVGKFLDAILPYLFE